jgi:uncharacterized protein YkwD
VAAVILGASLGAAPSRAWATVLWADNAENGAAKVIDGTAGSYSLIQSDVAGQGAWAFHLASPGLQDNWFEIAQPLDIEADTNLFFLSRLGWSTATQIARVQASTDGGASWPISLYNQNGVGDAGEGAFSLRQVNLAPYANQSLRLRFYYDVTGLAFPQTDPGVGWYIDDIQIADQLQKAQYSIGNPTADEQLYVEYINRARADALVEAARLADENDPLITSSYAFFGITGANIQAQFEYYVTSGLIARHAQPLAFNANLLTAARLHTQDMLAIDEQTHTSSANPPAPFPPGGSLGDRLAAVGYSPLDAAENVFAFASTVAEGHAGFDVDWGHIADLSDPAFVPAFVGQGMQNPAGHRLNIHNAAFKEIGIGVLLDDNSLNKVGPQLVTQDFGDPGNAMFITGVVYEDLNANDFYDIGEGRPGVRIDVDGSAYFGVSTDSGGYAVPVTGDGVYDVLFSGGGFSSYQTSATIIGGANVKIDYLVSNRVDIAGDFNGDGLVNAADLAIWTSNFGVAEGADADGDGDTDGDDFLVWQRQIGVDASLNSLQGVIPEPPSVNLTTLAVALMPTVRRRRGKA